MTRALAAIACLIALGGCRRDEPAIQPPPSAAPADATKNWPARVYTTAASDAKVALGRSLFYETMLSSDSTVSCGSCHQQAAGFANADHAVSHGVNGAKGTRNSPAIFNLAWHPFFMYDGGIPNLELQPLAPIANPVEMDLPIAEAVSRLQASQKYRGLFGAAFGTEEVSSQRAMQAFAAFLSGMVSADSKFDRYKRHEPGTSLTDAESRGYQQFLATCQACHPEPLFSDFRFRNNGLTVNAAHADSGRARITQEPSDLYKFKTPSLRNIAFTAPYMHDGRYATLEECVDHYTSHIDNHVNLDPRLATPLRLTPEQKSDLVAFLHTLSDFAYKSDPRYSDPNFK